MFTFSRKLAATVTSRNNISLSFSFSILCNTFVLVRFLHIAIVIMKMALALVLLTCIASCTAIRSAQSLNGTRCDPSRDPYQFLDVAFIKDRKEFVADLVRSLNPRSTVNTAMTGCDNRYVLAPTRFEGDWLRKSCKEGVFIGQALCSQASNNGTDIAPIDIVDRLDPKRGASDDWYELLDGWCTQEPEPHWTGFEDCYHACQAIHVDCEQVDYPDCRVCFDPIHASKGRENCQGVRGRDRYEYNGGPSKFDFKPPKKFSFLDACVAGCGDYAALKKLKKQGGPACVRGKEPITYLSKWDAAS